MKAQYKKSDKTWESNHNNSNKNQKIEATPEEKDQ